MYRIVIIEDEHLIRQWLHQALTAKSETFLLVGEAKDGREGSQLILDTQPDIVLTDINMPIMSAFDMFEATKEVSYAKIILSGFADFPNARNALHYGVLEFLEKPLTKDTLYQCLDQVLARLDCDTSQAVKIPYLTLPHLSQEMPHSIYELVTFIQTHYHEKLSISLLAQQLGYSDSYLYQLAKKHLDMTLNDYINQFRVNQAMRLLVTKPNMLVYQVAEAVGIFDYRYFDRVFKKYLGQNATQFREGIWQVQASGGQYAKTKD